VYRGKLTGLKKKRIPHRDRRMKKKSLLFDSQVVRFKSGKRIEGTVLSFGPILGGGTAGKRCLKLEITDPSEGGRKSMGRLKSRGGAEGRGQGRGKKAESKNIYKAMWGKEGVEKKGTGKGAVNPVKKTRGVRKKRERENGKRETTKARTWKRPAAKKLKGN